MKTTITLTLVALTYFANASVATAGDAANIINGVASLVGALNGNPVHVNNTPGGNSANGQYPVQTTNYAPPQRVHNGLISNGPNNGNPFHAGGTNPFGPTNNTSPLVGSWNSNKGPARISQNGSQLNLQLGRYNFVVHVNGNTVSLHHTASGKTYSGHMSADGNTIQFQLVTLTRQQPGPGPGPGPWVGGMRKVQLNDITCVDLQNDRIFDRQKFDHVELQVYADGQLVDTIRTRFSLAQEGRTKRIGREYSFSRNFEVKLLIGGNEIPGGLQFTMGSQRGQQQASFATGIDQRFEWTQYGLVANVL